MINGTKPRWHQEILLLDWNTWCICVNVNFSLELSSVIYEKISGIPKNTSICSWWCLDYLNENNWSGAHLHSKLARNLISQHCEVSPGSRRSHYQLLISSVPSQQARGRRRSGSYGWIWLWSLVAMWLVVGRLLNMIYRILLDTWKTDWATTEIDLT